MPLLLSSKIADLMSLYRVVGSQNKLLMLFKDESMFQDADARMMCCTFSEEIIIYIRGFIW